jgi:hypothetical protein
MEDFMERRDFEQHPEDLEQVADWLRAQRPEVTALELDRIKQRARAQAMRGERRGAGVARARRPLATVLTALVLTASFGGAFAIAGKVAPSSSTSVTTSAAKKQYQPGKGCGDPSRHQPPPPGPPKPCP